MSMLVENVAKRKGLLRKERISNGWWRRFLERQSDISLRRADLTAHIRMDSANKQSIQHYYDLLEATLKENNLTDCPGQIYNMDEPGMPLDPRAPNIVAKAGQKRFAIGSQERKSRLQLLDAGMR